jgi:hypothetical protein
MKANLSLLLCLIIASLSAQNKRNHALADAPYTYLYKLSNPEAEKIQQKPRTPIDSSYLHTLIDSFPTGSTYAKTPPPGQYLYAISSGLFFQYKLVTVSSMGLHVVNNGKDFALRILDKTTDQPITDAQVTLDGKTIPYDKSKLDYFLPGRQKPGKLRVEARGEILFTEMERSYSQSRGNWKPKTTGFIAFSRPQYRRGDTVKLKAFINFKKKPMNEPLELRINKSHRNWDKKEVILRAVLKPVSPGAYVFQFVVSDSFKLDKTYPVELYRTNKKKPEKNAQLFTSSFRTEDYQLDQTKYTLRSSEKVYAAGDSVILFLSGTDYNGLPLFDATAELEVTTDAILDPTQESEDFQARIYKKQFPLEASGETRIVLSPALFSASGARYNALVHFRNSNNEMHREALYFGIRQQELSIEVSATDTLYEINFLRKGKRKEAQGTITFIGNSADSLRTSTVHFPCKISPTSEVFALLIRCEGAENYYEVPAKTLVPFGHRNKDSVFIGVSNPGNKLFNWELYRGETRVDQGCSKNFRYTAADPGHSSYRILTYSCDERKNETQIINILPREKTLEVSLKQPAETYPGQQAEVNVLVKDYDAKPVKDANITLDCINAQFKAQNTPTLPDYNPEKELKKKQYAMYELQLNGVDQQAFCKSYWYKRLRLDTIPYFHIHFPGKTAYTNYIPLATADPQFAPFIVSKNSLTRIYFIYIDDKAIFALGNFNSGRYSGDDQSPWAFVVPEGRHTVRLRCYDKEYLISDVEFRKGQKLELSFEKDMQVPGITEIKRSRKFSKEEKDLLASNLFICRDIAGYSYSDQYFYQGNRIKAIQREGACLFQPGDSIHYQLEESGTTYRGSFLFKSGYAYSFNKDSLKMRPAMIRFKKLPRGNYYRFQNTSDTALTASVLRFPIAFGYGSRNYGACTKAEFTEKENASFAICEAEGLSVYRMELIKSDKSDGIVSYKYEENDYNGLKNRIENLSPGLYDAVYYDYEGNSYRKNSIAVQSGKLHLECLKKENFKALEKLQPQNVKCDYYELTYAEKPLQISGRFTGKGSLGDITVFVMRNGHTLLTTKSDASGAFYTTVKTPGIYDLYIVPDTTYKNCTLYNLVVTAAHSPELSIRLDLTYDYLHPYCTHNLAFQGQNIELHDHTASGEALLPISLRPEKHIRQELEHSFGRLGLQHGSSQSLSDATDFEEDGAKIYTYYRPTHHLFRHSYFSSGWSRNKSAESWEDVRFDGGFESRSGYGEKSLNAYSTHEDYDEVASYTSNLSSVQITSYNKKKRISSAYASHYEMEPDSKSAISFNRSSYGMLDTLSKPGDSYAFKKQLRKDFSDCAYWQPNLLTDDNGRVQFRFRFPDDVTGWKATALAITGNMQSGQADAFTKSYKPLLASLNTPRFLLPGDSATIIGKVMNYGKTALDVKTVFKVNKQIISQSSNPVSSGLTQKQTLLAPFADSLQLDYTLETKSGYSDGEQKVIPIYPIGTEEAKGGLFILDKDSTFSIQLDTAGKYTEVTALGNDLDLMISKLKYIRDYTYFCNEQMASKLNALLMEKTIYEKQGIPFRGEKEIKQLIHKLEKSQRSDGSWGWWEDSPRGNIFMTCYITHVLGKASRASFASVALSRGLEDIRFQLPNLTGNEEIHALTVLSENKSLPDAARYIAACEKEKNPTTWLRYTLLQLKQENGISISKDLPALLKEKKETILGGCYWGEQTTDWYDNRNQLSMLVYRILAREPDQANAVKGIRNYFLEHSDANTWRNTYETATILETILPELIGKYDAKAPKPKVELTGGLQATIDTYPYTAHLQATSNAVRVSKKGNSPVYFSVYKKSWNSHPPKKEDLYQIRTSFLADGKTEERLAAGQLTKMEVEVTALKKADYILIEIPIPAGCSYNEKKQSYQNYEVHREYFKNKVVIFCESLPVGTWKFEIELQPRFTGNYTLNPAKTELMYFPLLYGRNDLKRVIIEEKKRD